MRITDEAVQAALLSLANDNIGTDVQGLLVHGLLVHGFDKLNAKPNALRNALTVALPHLQVGYKIKQLEWFVKAGGDIVCDSAFGWYKLHMVVANSCFRLETPDGFIECKTPYSYWPEQEAKAAAQADFERRVRGCIDGTLTNEGTKPVDVAEAQNMLEQLIKAADEVVFHFGDNDNGFSIPSVNEADYICTSLGNYHEARAKLVNLIGALSAEPAQGGQWSSDMDLAPSDTVVLMAWFNSLQGGWEYEAGVYHSTRGGWWHGSATHWMPSPAAPTKEEEK